MNKQPSSTNRIWELDALRGIAIILMATFHLVFDLAFFFGLPIDYLHGFWYYEGLSSALLFMLVSGASSTLSRRPARRGLIVFGWGMALTIGTYLMDPSLYIRFGILQFLGAAMVLAMLVRKWRLSLLIPFSLAVIAVGVYLRTIRTTVPWLFPLGLITTSFDSLDYYPIFPYFGVYTLGIALGRLLYAKRRSLFFWQPAFQVLEVMGQHSLTIYLLHQPAILALLYSARALNLI
ncbi:MAG: heparan-alpha-glucosaminide N-acetyltransferase [Bacillota bacterium]